GRDLATEIPNARFKLLKGQIHPWWYGDSHEIIREILEFVGRKELGTPVGDTSQILIRKGSEEDVGGFPDDGSVIAEQATIVFSDIVSSTELVTELGDSAARDIFLKHDKIVRDQLKKYGGRELQNLGDGFMLSFESASAAINCACDIQRGISRKLPRIKVRMGINTGEVVRREGMHPFG
ncbi:MAG: adenylate/guanylate cyclase domain-containing protein, partial [Desulfobacteraceae bacterium]|nr:adenylate/guanylate cyclase domain-containing protein [Desulfobacteraceae bacterium]